MAPYRILLKPSVEKDLGSIPKGTVQRLLRRVEGLASEPIPRQSAKLTGAERLYRVRVGDYRIIYTVDHEARSVTIHYVRHRKDAYRSVG
ncbi:MAG: type II toxin-antitoxin system RelE/ParE family toxin [Anaerolineales bacterium]|nr:type II toxin-antitoxin system RelE/ParE family toxin [Anaerolineales bacterium]